MMQSCETGKTSGWIRTSTGTATTKTKRRKRNWISSKTKMNNVTLFGRITADPEVRYTKNNKACCRFSLAVDRITKGEVDFIRCIAWEQVAENLHKYIHKGDRLLVSGSIQTGSYEKDGKKVYTTDVFARSISYIDMHKSDGGFTPAQEEIPAEFQDDLPF